MNYKLIAPIFDEFSAIEQVLLNRGFSYSEIPHYLNTTDKDILDFHGLDNIQEGAEMLLRHIKNNSAIALVVDSDADGYTSAAILTNYLYQVFPECNLIHVMHPGKQHGIIIDELPLEANLVIAIDSSSSDYEQHLQLQYCGTEVLVIDHHEAPMVSDYACVINNQLCDYPTKSLSGAGMAYKFCCCLDELLGLQNADNFLDLAALGIVSDVMNLNDFETKRIIEKGLAHIKNPFMKEMISRNSYSLGDELTPTGVAFYIAPYINATIRVGEQYEKELLFKSMLTKEAYREVPSTKRGHKIGDTEILVEQACRVCSNVKSRQTKDRDKNLAIVEGLITDEMLENKILIICIPHKLSCNKNLTGLIANVLMDKYKRPVLLLNETTSKTGVPYWEGSARGYEKSKLKDFRLFLEECGVEEMDGYCQGHANAFGFGIPQHRAQDFWDIVKEKSKDLDFSASYMVDFIYKAKDCKSDFILDLANFKNLWGHGVEEPKIALEEVRISGSNCFLLSPDKNPTIKIVTPSGIACMKFKSSKEEYDSLQNKTVNLVGSCERNEWNGRVTAQIMIEDYEIAEDYYF